MDEIMKKLITKLYYATDVLKSAPWGNDAEAQNLLALHRPKAPSCQAITLDQFRQISLTVDEYLSKQAWSTEGAFSSFNSVMLGWIGETKRIYDSTTYNAFIGTTETAVGAQDMEIDVTTATQGLTGEEKARVEASTIAQEIAKLLVRLEDVSRDYNDYGYLRSYYNNDLMFVWNADAMAKIEKRDLPTIFHKDIVDRFGEYTLPARYFGTVNDKTVTSSDGVKIRSLIEQDVVDRPVEEPISCVYGPPEWYDRNGNLDDNHSSVRRFKEKIRGFYSRLFEKKRE